MYVVEQAVDCDVPPEGVNERGTKRLAGRGNQWTRWRWVAENVAYDLIRDPAVLGVFFCPEIHKIQFNIPKFHFCRLEMLGLVGVSLHSYRVLNEFILVGSEELSQAVRE